MTPIEEELKYLSTEKKLYKLGDKEYTQIMTRITQIFLELNNRI